MGLRRMFFYLHLKVLGTVLKSGVLFGVYVPMEQAKIYKEKK
jgi:hypothetical protein